MAEKSSSWYNLVVVSGPLLEFSGLMLGISELTADNTSPTNIAYGASFYYIGRIMASSFVNDSILERLNSLEKKLTELGSISKTE